MKRVASLKPVDKLTIADLSKSPVWQFSTSESHDETMVRPISRIPVKSLSGRVVGSQVCLANGNKIWSLIGNVEVHNARLTEHFMSASFLLEEKSFALARYFDPDYERRSPQRLAEFLGLAVDAVFPIVYDIRSLAVGDPDALCGRIEKEPRERLTRAQVIALAVPKKSEI